MFTIGSATGVQFHPEVTEGIIRDWLLAAGREERDEIMSQTFRNIKGSNRICRSIFNGFLAGSAI
jgi:GMP synthase-like glutamine amidotransferase